MVNLIPARPEDEQFLYQLYISTRQHEAVAWGWDKHQAAAFFAMQYQLRKQSYRLQFPEAEHSVVLREGCPVGQLIVWRSKGRTVLVDVTLLPEYRGRGIGTLLVRQLQAQAQAERSTLGLHVLNGNPAVRLYERLGFHISERGDVRHAMEWKPQEAGSGKGAVVEWEN